MFARRQGVQALQARVIPSTGNLKPGGHVLKARATDKAGNTDPTPAKAKFHIRKPHRHHH